MASIDLSHRIIQDAPPPKTPVSAVRWHPWRRLLQVVLGILLVILPFTNGLRVDVVAGAFYFAGHRMASHDMLLMFWIGVTALWILISVSFLYGRFWCGWVCPQTLASDYADSLKRRIDKAFRARPGRPSYLPARALWSTIMVVTAVAFGALLVCYWADPVTVGASLIRPAAAPGVAFAVYAVSFVLAADLLWIRRKFCSGVCPYGLLISSIADKDTLAVRYLNEREDDCIKCGQCVNVCPMGIDIKTGVGQMECIGCGECVDACNDVLGKRSIPGLIEYRYGVEPERTMASLKPAQRAGLWDLKRIAILATTLLCLAAVLVTAFRTGASDVSLWPGGRTMRYGDHVASTYNISLSNGRPEPQTYDLEIAGIPGAAVLSPSNTLALDGHDSVTRNITITVPYGAVKPDTQVRAKLVLSTHRERIEAPLAFYMPPQ